MRMGLRRLSPSHPALRYNTLPSAGVSDIVRGRYEHMDVLRIGRESRDTSSTHSWCYPRSARLHPIAAQSTSTDLRSAYGATCLRTGTPMPATRRPGRRYRFARSGSGVSGVADTGADDLGRASVGYRSVGRGNDP